MEERKYPQKSFRMNDEIVKHLQCVAILTGMSESDIVRGLIEKAYKDETCRKNLRKHYDAERARAAGIDLTSYNARSENGEKNGSLGTSEPRNVDQHPVSGQEDDTVSDEELQNTLQRLKDRRNHQTREPAEETQTQKKKWDPYDDEMFDQFYEDFLKMTHDELVLKWAWIGEHEFRATYKAATQWKECQDWLNQQK